MPLNIRPFEFQYRGLGPGPQQVQTPSWGPPDMSKQLQEGIGNILPSLAAAYKGVNEQRNMELQGATLDKARATLGAGTAYTGGAGTTASGAPITAANASPQSDKPYTFSKEVEPLFQSTATATGVSPDYYKRVAGIESGGDIKAKNPNSSATGLFQFTDATWKDYGGGGDRLNANDQFAAMGRLTVANRDNLRSVLGRDPTDGELYLAHQQGAGGAKALLSNPTGNVVDVLSTVYGGDRATAEKAVRNNGGNLNMTANQFAARWVGGTANTPGGGYGGTMGAPPTVVAASTVQPGDTVAPGASAVSGGRMSDPALAYKTRLQEMYPNIRVTSEFRSQADNNRVGGAKGSQHLAGNALDVDVSKLSDQEKQAFVNDAISNGAKGIGWYNNNSMHVDFRQTPAAWGPNKSYSSIGQTPPWFQEAAAKLKGGSVNAASSPVPASSAPSQVAASSPGVVTQTPAVRGATPGGQNQQPLFSTPQLQGATQAAGQQPPPGQNPTQAQNPNPQTALQGAPAQAPAQLPPSQPAAPMQGAPPVQQVPGTAGMVAGPGVPSNVPDVPPSGLTFGDILRAPSLDGATKDYFASMAQTVGPDTPLNPRAILMDPKAPEGAKMLAQNLIDKPPPQPAIPAQGSQVGSENIQKVLDENGKPTLNPQLIRPAPAERKPPVVPAGVVAPAPGRPGTDPSVGVTTSPNRPPPPPPAVTTAAQPQTDPATTGSVASRRDAPANPPPAAQAVMARAGVRDPSSMDNLSLELLARAFKSGNPQVVQATTNAINALTEQRKAAAGEGGWTYHKDTKTGQEVRFNSKTGVREVLSEGSTSRVAQDLILAPNDPRRKDYPGIPNDQRTYRVHPTADSIDITPLDERESKTFEQEQHLADKFETNEVVKKYRGMEQGIAAVGSAFKSGTPESDMLGIIQMFKTMDPTSTVSAGETANAENAPGVDQRVISLYNKWLEGGGKFTAVTRQNFYNGLRGILESQRAQADALATGTANTAKGYNLDPVRTMERWKPATVPEMVKDPNVFANRKADGTVKTSQEEEAEAKQPGGNRMRPLVQTQDYPNVSAAVDAAEQQLRDMGRTWGWMTIRVEGKKPVTRFVGERLED